MSWLEKLLPPKIQPTDPSERRSIPEGLWIKCPSCETVLYKNDLDANVNVCPKCGHHHRISARARLDAFLDAEGRFEIGQEVLPVDALKFKDNKKYPDRLKQGMEATGETDALIVLGGSVCSIPVVAAMGLSTRAATLVCGDTMPRVGEFQRSRASTPCSTCPTPTTPSSSPRTATSSRAPTSCRCTRRARWSPSRRPRRTS